MGRVRLDITMSLDGFVAGPDADLENPLGQGGMRLHEWVFGLSSWREQHGESGGETNSDDDVVKESLGSMGAVLMGRKMFSGGEGPWEDDPNARGWWGDDPPFDVPVFVLTHHPREPLALQGTTMTFVTEGADAALEQARAAAADKDVLVAGGADVAQQYLRAGGTDETQIHVAPILLGSGVRLFENLGAEPPMLESMRVLSSPAVTHLRFRVVK